MKKATIKLKTERGATLLLALLLFMVCCAVGIVVLTAGTASSGRTADLARMDRRYYSVTSAVNLLAELVDGKTVTVEQTSTPETTTVTTEDEESETVYTGNVIPDEFVTINGQSLADGDDPSGLPLLMRGAYALCAAYPEPNPADSINWDDVWSRKIPDSYEKDAYPDAGPSPWSVSLTLIVDAGLSDPLLTDSDKKETLNALQKAVNVDIRMTLLKDGGLGFSICNPETDNQYQLYLYCPAKIRTTTGDTKTTTITWTAGEISARKNWTE